MSAAAQVGNHTPDKNQGPMLHHGTLIITVNTKYLEAGSLFFFCLLLREHQIQDDGSDPARGDAGRQQRFQPVWRELQD